MFYPSLDQKQKELIQQKEDLLRDSKTKSSTLDNVKTQIDLLVKVRKALYFWLTSVVTSPSSVDSIRDSEKGR
jgi:hypothetical protein